MAEQSLRKILLTAYPQIDILPIDPDDLRQVDEAVRNEETGDALFNFLWRELGEAGRSDEAIRVLDQALEDLQAVRDAIEEEAE